MVLSCTFAFKNYPEGATNLDFSVSGDDTKVRPLSWDKGGAEQGGIRRKNVYPSKLV